MLTAQAITIERLTRAIMKPRKLMIPTCMKRIIIGIKNRKLHRGFLSTDQPLIENPLDPLFFIFCVDN